MSMAFAGQLLHVAEPSARDTVLLRHAVQALLEAAPTADDAKPAGHGIQVVEFGSELYVPVNNPHKQHQTEQ